MSFYMVSAYLGGTLYAFLRGIRILGGHFVCIFTWYSHSWGTLHGFLRGIRIPGGPSQIPCQEPSGLQVYYVNPCLELATAGLYSESLHRA